MKAKKFRSLFGRAEKAYLHNKKECEEELGGHDTKIRENIR